MEFITAVLAVITALMAVRNAVSIMRNHRNDSRFLSLSRNHSDAAPERAMGDPRGFSLFCSNRYWTFFILP